MESSCWMQRCVIILMIFENAGLKKCTHTHTHAQSTLYSLHMHAHKGKATLDVCFICIWNALCVYHHSVPHYQSGTGHEATPVHFSSHLVLSCELCEMMASNKDMFFMCRCFPLVSREKLLEKLLVLCTLLCTLRIGELLPREHSNFVSRLLLFQRFCKPSAVCFFYLLKAIGYNCH